MTDKEIAIAHKALELALKEGAGAVRVSLNKTLLELAGVLNGSIDKLTHALDRSLQLSLFVDGRYGTFSTNFFEDAPLEAFVRQSVAMVRMLQEDQDRCLPDPARTVKDACSGKELGLWDEAWTQWDADTLRELALSSCVWKEKDKVEKGFRLLSEEGEISVNVTDNLVLDSNGLSARHCETSFEVGFEVTVEDTEGNHFEDYWWDSSPSLEGIRPALKTWSREAIRRAAQQIGPQAHPGGRLNMVVDAECVSKLLTPLLNALGGFSIQQKNSFLLDRLGQRLFPESLTLMDRPCTPGATGAKLFDSEGVAAKDRPIIDHGVLSCYFINTYIARKTGLEATVEAATRPVLLPFGGCKTREDLLRKMGSGILVTGFNGGNSNSSTGDFSFGIEGFAFEDGVLTHPVREMLISGNLIQLWSSLTATADDARLCMSKLIPTLAFSNVDFSA